MSKCEREFTPVILTDEQLEIVSGGGDSTNPEPWCGAPRPVFGKGGVGETPDPMARCGNLHVVVTPWPNPGQGQ